MLNWGSALLILGLVAEEVGVVFLSHPPAFS